jgi:hypothetical protein
MELLDSARRVSFTDFGRHNICAAPGCCVALMRAGPHTLNNGVFLAEGSPVTKVIITLSNTKFSTICAACSVQGGQCRRAQAAACNQTLAEGAVGRGWSGAAHAMPCTPPADAQILASASMLAASGPASLNAFLASVQITGLAQKLQIGPIF